MVAPIQEKNIQKFHKKLIHETYISTTYTPQEIRTRFSQTYEEREWQKGVGQPQGKRKAQAFCF